MCVCTVEGIQIPVTQRLENLTQALKRMNFVKGALPNTLTSGKVMLCPQALVY